MVMHQRKLPRLNDGYHDRSQSHPYEDKNSSKYRHAYSDRYGDQKRGSPNFRRGTSSDIRGSSGRDRDESPASRSSPRYQNKSSYMERNKDYAGNSVGKRSSHDRAKGGKDSRNREQKERDHRAEVRKTAVRVCGDWSEHISSKGKCYYYNCKTEESKWEKPKEWIDSTASKPRDSKERRPVVHSKQKSYEDKHKHSSSATITTASSSSSSERHRSSSLSGSHHHHNNSRGPATGGPSSAYHSGQSDASDRYPTPSNSSGHHNNGQTRHKTSTAGASHLDRTFTSPDRPKGYDHHRHSDRLNSHGEHDLASWHGDKSSSSGTTTYRSSHVGDYNGARRSRGDHEDSRQAEDMDISPGSTPTEESLLERQHGTPATSAAAAAAHTQQQQRSPSALLAMLTNLNSLSDLPTLANNLASAQHQSSLASTTIGTTTTTTSPGAGSSPGTILPQILQQLMASSTAPSAPQQQQVQHQSAQGQGHGSQQVLQQAIQVLQKFQQNLVAQQKQQQQLQLQQLLVSQLQQLQNQLQQQHSSRHTAGPPAQQQQQQAVQAHPTPQQHKAVHNKTVDRDQSPYSPPDESDGTPLQSPEYNNSTSGTSVQPHTHPHPLPHHPHHHHHHDDNSRITSGRESPRRDSPTPSSHTSSQNLSSAMVASQLSATHRKRADSVHLTPSLANYYQEDLIGHVSGLIYNPTERLSDVAAEDVHRVGSLECTQVSVDLKGARSMVRVGEIISTLHEQRILFIRQQIKDLDSCRSYGTFMNTAAGPASSALSLTTTTPSTSPAPGSLLAPPPAIPVPPPGANNTSDT